VEVNDLKTKLGIYAPVYGGWTRGVKENEAKPNYKYAADSAKKAEDIGIHSIWVPDHMLNPIKGEREPSLEAWTTLTAIAAQTTRIELFHTTICQGFRYPAVLAKMAATLDDVSDGRFRFSIGSGWYQREFQAYGAPWYDHDTKIDVAREQIEIIKSLWTQPTTNYKGRFYEIVEGVLEPKPVQKPHPPIWWGGDSKKSMELAADLADGWLMSASTIDEAEEKTHRMGSMLGERGGRKMMFAIPGQIFIGESDEEARSIVKRLAGENENLYRNIVARGFVGSPSTIADRVKRLSDLGFDYVILQPTPALEMLNMIEEQLLPVL
jgi:FMNH2-dependent dimethyl sulfone monooxygenase